MTRRMQLCLMAIFLAFPVSVRAQMDINDETESAMKEAAAKVAPSIVRIETSGGQDIIVWTDRATGAPIRKVVGPTTGLVVDPDGYLVEGEAFLRPAAHVPMKMCRAPECGSLWRTEAPH